MRIFKKISLLVLMAVMVSGTSFAAFVNPPDASINSEKKGVAGRKIGEQAAVILLVRNSSTSASSAGILSEDVVVYDTNSDDGVSVRTTTTSADGAIAGIAVTTIQTSDAATGTSAADDYGRRNWGYILVHGKCTAKATAGGTNGSSIGDPFITSTDAGAITSFISFDTSTVAINMNRIAKIAGNTGGFFYDAGDGSTTSYEVQVDLE